MLTDDDWIVLEKVNKTLTILKHATKCLEGSFSSLSLVMPAMDLILTHFETMTSESKDATHPNYDPTMAPRYQAGWEKLEHYYRGTDSTPVYAAAMVLHPMNKWDYLEENWKKEWVDKAKVSIASLA